MKLKRLFEEILPSKITTYQEKVTDLCGKISLDITGDEGGKWTLNFDKIPATITKDIPPNSNLTITIDCKDFKGLLNGTLNPITAYFAGKINLAGDIALAMKLKDLLKQVDLDRFSK